MKRLTLLLVAAALAIALLAVFAYAQQLGGGGIGPIGPAPGAGPFGPPGFEGSAPMGWGRVGQPAIAVSGSFVYVVSGGMLLQYDQRLNLVNRVELPGALPGAGPGPGGGMGRARGDGGPGGGGGGGRGGGGRRAGLR